MEKFFVFLFFIITSTTGNCCLAKNNINLKNIKSIRTIELEVESDKIINLKQLPDTIYNANSEVIAYTIKSPGTMYIKANKIGSTDLILLNNKGKVITKYYINVTHKISKIKEILTKTFPKDIKNLRFSSVDNNLVITGKYNSIHSQKKIHEIIRSLADEKSIIDMSSVKEGNANPQINLRIKVVEMNRTVKKALGLNFGLNFGGTANGTNSSLSFNSPELIETDSPLSSFLIGSETLPGLFAGNFSLRSLLNIMSDEHLITSLAEPNLVLLPGEPASFMFGGEVPIFNQAGLGGTAETDFKEFGIKIEAQAEILKNNIIRIKLQPSISKVSEQLALTVPNNNNDLIKILGFLTRSITTTIELKSGQSIAIAGLIESETTQEEVHIPGLDRLPIIKDLTRQENAKRQENEIVFIVTPYLIHPVANNSLETPTNSNGLPKSGAAIGQAGFIIG